VPGGPPRPGEPVVVPRAVAVTATVEVVWLVVAVRVGRVVVVVVGRFVVVVVLRAVVAVAAFVPDAPEELVGGAIIVVTVVVPVAGTLAASEAPRSSLP
jgi:hypothetical protein